MTSRASAREHLHRSPSNSRQDWRPSRGPLLTRCLRKATLRAAANRIPSRANPGRVAIARARLRAGKNDFEVAEVQGLKRRRRLCRKPEAESDDKKARWKSLSLRAWRPQHGPAELFQLTRA